MDSEDVPPTVDQAVPSTRSFTTNMFARKKTKTSTESSPASSPTQEATAGRDSARDFTVKFLFSHAFCLLLT